MVDDDLWRCSFMNNEILCYLILFIFSIMIDVKLTSSGLWWTAYLFVWMGRRRAGLVGLHCLVSSLRIAGASSVYFACRVLERLWSRMTFILCFGFYLLLGFDYDLVVLLLLMTWLYYWSVCWYSAVMIYVKIFYACLLWIIRRHGVYFLIMYYNCVIYSFNINRALHPQSVLWSDEF